jgi:hypothetical protein
MFSTCFAVERACTVQHLMRGWHIALHSLCDKGLPRMITSGVVFIVAGALHASDLCRPALRALNMLSTCFAVERACTVQHLDVWTSHYITYIACATRAC